LKDAVPEVVFLNSHDGTSAYIMLIFACHQWHKSTYYPAYLQLGPCPGTVVTVSAHIPPRVNANSTSSRCLSGAEGTDVRSSVHDDVGDLLIPAMRCSDSYAMRNVSVGVSLPARPGV